MDASIAVTSVATGGVVGANMLPVLGFGAAGIKASTRTTRSGHIVC